MSHPAEHPHHTHVAPVRFGPGVALVVAGLAVAMLTVFAHLNPLHSLVVNQVLDRPIAMSILAYLLVIAGLRLFIADRLRRLLVTILTIAFGAAAFGLAGLISVTFMEDDRVGYVVTSPDGRFDAEVTDNGRGQMMRRVADVHVQHHDLGWTARRWEAACINGDTPSTTVDQVSWADATTLVVRLASGAVRTVRIDPRTGEPADPVRVGMICGVLTPTPTPSTSAPAVISSPAE